MSNSYRIRTEVGKDKSIKILLDQDFEFLEILSLKIGQTDVYTRQCSDYGVVIGRVITNGGFGIPNAKISIFIPLSREDENNPAITELYPYKSLKDTNEDGYRYNLLPKVKSYSEHSPTGSFFTKEEVLTNPSIIEVFDKYYKYTSVTNESGDFMIFGVPVGLQKIHMDVDLSDIGEFSQSPQDLIRIGLANEEQVAGTKFKTTSNLSRLPQIVTIDKEINVEPLWGQPEICNLGISRVDFDLSEELNITIQPTAIFMGSLISDLETLSLRKNCKPKFKQGELCNLVTGPGQIQAIRQTIFDDSNGRPILETFDLDNGGQVIDEDGTWLLDVPMNMDYVTTNEFGERIISNDPKVGVPTTAKYRFKIKWNQSPSLSENIKRGYFLVPNIREYGWDSGGNTVDLTQQLKSYSFSLDWDDYADIQSAINCEDTFYPMVYNKVYTASQMIDRFRNGTLPNRFVSIKNVLDDRCESEHNKFPTNDSVYRSDILFLLFQLVALVTRILAIPLVFVIHVLFFLIDYIDLLSTRKRNVDRKGEIDDIYLSTKGLARELKVPIWSVSQVNRAGAKDDIIEGDKAAGSYDKIMITDVAISLSRKKEDKVKGTGRFHIMKNRYGMDGLTFGAKIDTSTGHMEIFDNYDDDPDQYTPSKPVNSFSDVTSLDRDILQQKFFELSK